MVDLLCIRDNLYNGSNIEENWCQDFTAPVLIQTFVVNNLPEVVAKYYWLTVCGGISICLSESICCMKLCVCLMATYVCVMCLFLGQRFKCGKS